MYDDGSWPGLRVADATFGNRILPEDGADQVLARLSLAGWIVRGEKAFVGGSHRGRFSGRHIGKDNRARIGWAGLGVSEAEDEVGGAFGDHDDGGVGVAAGEDGDDGGVDHAEVAEAFDP